MSHRGISEPVSPVFKFRWVKPGGSRSFLAGVLGQNESGVDRGLQKCTFQSAIMYIKLLQYAKVSKEDHFQVSAVAHFQDRAPALA